MEDRRSRQEELQKALDTIVFEKDLRTTPDEETRAEFHAGCQAAADGGEHRGRGREFITWYNAGYRLGLEFAGKPDYMDAAYELTVEDFKTKAARPVPPDDFVDGPDLERLDEVLVAFTRYREENEEKYLADERNYKVEFFATFRRAWESLAEEPDETRRFLIDVLEGTGGPPGSAFNNLLGGRGAFIARTPFKVYLQDIGSERFAEVMASLFDAARDPAERIDDFGRELRANYRRRHMWVFDAKFRFDGGDGAYLSAGSGMTGMAAIIARASMMGALSVPPWPRRSGKPPGCRPQSQAAG